jgi:hypothetical protein
VHLPCDSTCATFRRGQLSLQSNEFLAARTQFRSRVVVPIARKHLLPDPLFFRCIFSGRSRRSERHVATRIGDQIISKDGIVTSGRRLRRCEDRISRQNKHLNFVAAITRLRSPRAFLKPPFHGARQLLTRAAQQTMCTTRPLCRRAGRAQRVFRGRSPWRLAD